jgi:hypothetical protein
MSVLALRLPEDLKEKAAEQAARYYSMRGRALTGEVHFGAGWRRQSVAAG